MVYVEREIFKRVVCVEREEGIFKEEWCVLGMRRDFQEEWCVLSVRKGFPRMVQGGTFVPEFMFGLQILRTHVHANGNYRHSGQAKLAISYTHSCNGHTIKKSESAQMTNGCMESTPHIQGR